MDKKIKERWEAIDQGLVPKGYKKTKLGIIPEDWDVKKLGEVAEVISGGTPSTSAPEYWADDVLWATPGDITSTGKYIYDTSRKISNLGLEKSSARLLPENSILMTSRATIGECSINKLPMATNQGFKSFICYGINYEYLYYNMENLKKVFKSKASGSTFLEISKKDVDNTKIQIPPLEEQERIADILSTWDRTMESYGKLLEEKKERKKGLMQLLLTGEKRLGGFTGPWKEVRLGDVIEERNETGFEDYDLLAITMKDGVVKRETINIKDTSSSDKSKYKLIKPGDIGYNTMRMWQGVSGVSEYLGIVSPAYTILKISNFVDSNYLGYLFKFPLMINKFFRYSQGLVKDTLNLKYNNFKVIKITLPGLEEQKAIAEVLATADREIGLLEKLIEELKEEKKGLMQLLLKGIVRV